MFCWTNRFYDNRQNANRQNVNRQNVKFKSLNLQKVEKLKARNRQNVKLYCKS